MDQHFLNFGAMDIGHWTGTYNKAVKQETTTPIV
jgi:hypothetical protein